jgi:ribosome-binding factor A
MSKHRERRRDRERHGDRRGRATTLEEKYFGVRTEAVANNLDDGHEAHLDPKALRLCRQVREQLDLALAELGDPALDGTYVHDVAYVGGTHTIRVDVTAPRGADPTAIAARLEVVRGRLRSEIAAAIHRKRTPMLSFAVLPADWLELLRDSAEGEVEEDQRDHE